MPDQQTPVAPPQQSNGTPLGQTAPVVRPDLGISSGLIDNRPLQAPLPPVNVPNIPDPNGGQGQPRNLAELFNSMETPSDKKSYLEPQFTPQPLTKRYANFNPDLDNEEVAAKNQSWYDRWANGLVKMGATAIGTFAEGLMTVPDTVNAIRKGNLASVYQSDQENNVDTWLKNLEDEFPNYYSKWEQSHPFLSALPFSGGAANFWSDKVVKNLGFTVGAIGSAMAQDFAVGLATEGIGEIPLLGSQLGKASLWLNKIFSNESKLGEFLGSTKPGLLTSLTQGATEAGVADKTMFDLKELAKMAAYKKVTDAGRFAVNLYGSARTEGGFEARDGFNQVKQDLTDQFKQDNNRDPNQEEINEIEKYATAGANVRFGANMALLTLSDAIQFDNILKPFSAAKEGITASLQKSLEKEGEEIGIKEGTIDTFEKKEPQGTMAKIWNRVKPVIPNILAEGVYEEGGQYAAQVATQNYYERKYFQDKKGQQEGPDKTPWSPSTVLNILHSTMQGLSGEFGTTDGWENIILGGITAILTGGFEHYYDKIKGKEAEKDKSTQATLAVLNNNGITGLLQNMFGNATKSASLMQEMQDSVKSGDLFKYKNGQSDMFTNFVLAHLQSNRFDVAMEKLNIAKELPQEEFEKAFGMDKSIESKQTVSEYIDALKEKAQSIKNNFDALNEVFQNPYTFRTKAKTEDQNKENENHTKFEEWKNTLLEQTAHIDDANRRLRNIASKVNGVDPSISRDLIENLTHPDKLKALQREYNQKIAEGESLIAGTTPKDKKEIQKQVDAYRSNAQLIQDFFDSKPDTRDDQFLKTFGSVLNFEANGQQAPADNQISIKKQLLPSLIRDGVDANKLQARKTIASKAYDILTSQNGFNRFFNSLKRREGISASVTDNLPHLLDVNPDNISTPIEVGGGKSMVFKEDQPYTVSVGDKENPKVQTLVYKGVATNGDLNFLDESGKSVDVPPTSINSLEDQVAKTANAFKKQSAEVGSGAPISTEAPVEEGDRKKDLSFGPVSTTDPLWHDTSEWGNAHRRHQTFLFNLGSTDPEEFNQAVKPTLRILPVTEKIAQNLGFPKEFIKAAEGQEPVIRAVYVSVEGTDAHVLDHNGNKIQALDGQPVDPNKIIFTTLPSTNLQWKGEDRYTNKQNLDPQKVKEWHEAFRKALSEKDASHMPVYQFQVSRGLPNIINQGSRNKVTEVGLVEDKDLNKPVITIPTQGNVAIAALLNDEGEGIASQATGVNMPVGVPLLNHGGNLVYLNNRKFTAAEAGELAGLIEELAKRAQQNKAPVEGEEEGVEPRKVLDQTILRYLSRVLYFSNPQEGKAATNEQVWIDRTGIHFGNVFAVPFFADTIAANREKVVNFLADTFHNVNNAEINRATKESGDALKFNKLAMKEGKLTSVGTWPTYQHYLLTSDNAPLATNIAVPVDNEPPIVQKYSVLQVQSFTPSAFQSDKPQKTATKPALQTVTNKEKARPKAGKRIIDLRHAQDKTDTLGVQGGVNDTLLTKEGEASAKKMAEELLDKGIVQIYSSYVRRAGHTAQIIANLTGARVDDNSSIAQGLGDWKIGQWVGATDEDFNRAMEFYAKNPNEKTFEGKTLDESFGDFVKRFIETREQIERDGPDGTLVITHSKNLRAWDAYLKNGRKTDGNFADLFLGVKATPNTQILERDKAQAKDNEVEATYNRPDGKSVKYAQVFDNEGNISGVRYIQAYDANGKEINLNKDQIALTEKALKQGLGLVSETPQITAPPPPPIKTPEPPKKEVVEKKEEPKLPAKPQGLPETQGYTRSEATRKILDYFAETVGIPKFEGSLESGEYVSYLQKNSADPELGQEVTRLLGQPQKAANLIEENAKRKAAWEKQVQERQEAEKKQVAQSAIDKLRGHKGRPEDTQYRAAYVIPGSYTPANIEEEFAKTQKMLPNWVQFRTTQSLIHMTGGGKAWGAMKDAAIYVYQNAEQGTTYHEAFELVWQNFLQPAQQMALYTEFKGRGGEFTDYMGNKTQFSEANFKQAKEQIAEEFRDYVLGDQSALAPKQKNWFSRLVDFIKNMFLGPQDSINQVFKQITQGYYSSYPASQKNINSIEYRNIKASEAFVQDVLQGMTADLFSREFEKDSAIVTQLEEKPQQAVATIYGRLFNSLNYFFTSDDPNAKDTLQAIYADKMEGAKNEGEQTQIAQEYEGIQKHWDFIRENWNEFVNEHMKYLRVFKVEFSVDDNGEITMDSTSRRELEDYEKMTGQSEYARDMMTINARNSASEKVKLLFATVADREFISKSVGQTLGQIGESAKTRIKRENSQVRLPKLASYAKTFNYVLHNVTNINGLYDIYKKLVGMSNNPKIRANANVDALVRRLDFKHGFSSKSLDQAKMLLAVENTLNKQKPDFVRQFVDDQGNVYFKTSIINSRVDQTVDNWITDMKAAKGVKTGKDSTFIFDKAIVGIKDPIEMLEALGIGIDKEDYNALDAATKTKFNQEVEAIRSLMQENQGKKLPIFTTKQLGIDSRLINLASIYVDKMVGDDTDSMHFNLDGELTANFVLPNYVSAVQNDANNSKTREEFIAKNPQFNDIFHKDSILLNQIIFGKDGKFISPVNIAVVEGRESADTDNRSASSLSEAERYIYEINNNLQGIFYTLLPADAKTEWAIYTGQYIRASEYFDEITGTNAKNKFYDQMYSHLLTEIALAKDFNTNPNRQNITELNKLYEGRRKGESLRFFADILPTNRVSDIHANVIDSELPLEQFLTKEDFAGLMDSWIKDKANKSFKYLTDRHIFSESNQGNLQPNGILTEFLRKYLGNKRFYNEESVKNLLAFREMNYVLNNVEMHKFFFGDPAQYSDEMKRIKSFLSGREWSHVDYLGTAEGFNQWANGTMNRVNGVELDQNDPGYHTFANEMHTLTLHDVHVESSALELLEETLGKEAKPYQDMNEADAQSWQMGTSYREALLKAGGRWTQQMEDQFQYEMAYERQAKRRLGTYTYSSPELEREDMRTMRKGADPDAYFYITKPIHSGIQTVGDTAVMSLDKTSTAPLFYRFAEGRGILDLYNSLQKNGYDYVRVESAHKVGIQNTSFIPMYREDGSVNKEGIDKATRELIPFKYYGIQVDTSGKKEGQTEGSQLRKQAVGDLMDDGVPIDFINVGHKANNVAAKAAWEQLNEEEREAISPIYKLVKQHDADLSGMANKRYQNLLNKLGVTELEDGYDYKDVKKVSDFLLNEVTRRELPNNLRDAIEPDPDNPRQFRVPLEALTNYQQVRSILWSTIEKNIIRPKVSGGMKVQLAATGWEKEHRVVKKMVNGKPVLTSSDLKFYGKDEKGGTTKCEVYLPFWFGKRVRERLENRDSEGTARGTTFNSDAEFRKHILDYLNKSEEGQKLLSGIGFRIPTQRDNSIESFIVKDFLPEQMGDTIVLPSEITAKAGSDFDIDKMNTYLRNFFLDKKGYPHAIPFENVDSNDQEELKDYYEKYMLENRREYERWQSQKATNQLVNKIFRTEQEDEEPEYVPTLEEYLLQAQGKSAYEINSLEAIENKYFDTLEKIYSLPEKFKGLVSPNDASDLKAIAQKIAKLKDPNYNENKQPYGRALDSMWMMQERHKYLVGKKGVGIAAVSQTNLNVNQNAQVYLRVPRGVEIRLPYNTVNVGDKSYVSLGSIRNQSGDFLSRVNAMFIDGYVDIAKGAWIIDMGANDDLAKNFLLMCKWGTDPYDVALFMNQPAISMYNNERATQKSVAQLNKETRVLNSRMLYDFVGAKFRPGQGKAQLAKTKPAKYNRQEMESMIAKYGRGEKLSTDEAKLQMQMLSDYQEYDKLAWDMFRFFQGYNWDTSRLNDPNLVRKKMIMEERAMGGPISSIQKVFNTSFVGAVRSATMKIDGALRSLFGIQTGNAGLNLDKIADDLSARRGVGIEDYRKAMLKAELSMLDYTTQTQIAAGGRTLNRWIDQLLLGENSAAKYLEAIKNSGDISLTSNPIIKNLRANIDKREGKPSNIELIEKDTDSYTSNVWTDALRELADNQKVISIDNNQANDLSVAQIYRRMVLASILQSGTKRSSTSWTHLIPNEHYSAVVKDALRDIKANMDNFYEGNVLYRTNWEDDVLVPRVQPETRDDFDQAGQLVTRRIFPSYNSNDFNRILEDNGVRQIPKVLRLNQFEYSDKKVVKTVEYKRDPRTKQIIERTIRLFQRVDTVSDGGGSSIPLIASRRELIEGDFMERNVKYAVFKEINKWGDGSRVQEYYDNQVDSRLSSNPLVHELSDELVTFAIMNSGFSVNSDEFFLSTLNEDIARDRVEAVAQGESAADTEPEGEEPVDRGWDIKTPISFKEVNIEDVKKATKKDFFNISNDEGEVGEIEGYKVNVKSHPDLDLYVRKFGNKDWALSDNKSGKQVGPTSTSIKGAIESGINKINEVVKSGKNQEVLGNLGLTKNEIDDVLKDKDKGCK